MQKLHFGLALLTLAVVAVLTLAACSEIGPQRTAASPPVFSLQTPVSPTGCGTVTARETSDTAIPAPASSWTFPQYSFLRLQATKADGCTFSSWHLRYASNSTITLTDNPTSFQLSENMTVTARFTGTPSASPTPTPTTTATPTATPSTASCTAATLGHDPATNVNLAKDCATLLAAKDTLRGTGTLNWSANAPLASWDGVSLGGTPRRVSGLNLDSRRLTGSIPAGLGSLAGLRTLYLSGNQLTGTIPPQLGNLSALTQLHLNRNRLTGVIPTQLGSLANLRYLSLGFNRLTGSIPTELGNLTRLTSLWLRDNQLSGAIPTQLGQLTRLRELLLPANQLTGAIPSELGDLTLLRRLGLNNNRLTGDVPVELANLTALTHVTISGNTLTGCVPGVWADVANNDLATLGLPYCGITLSYDSYDATGAVTAAGSYAFLTEAADGTMSAVTSYEALRDGTASSLLIHKSDAAGTSRAKFYDAVAAGDLVEWKEADDCFVRYTVTAVKPDPAGTVPRKSLGVEWMTYAFTGCSGAVSTGADASVTWGTLADLGGTALTAPVVHGGAYQIVPAGWTGATREPEDHEPSTWSYVPTGTGDITEAQKLPYWRAPALPEGWAFDSAYVDRLGGPSYGYCATYRTEPRPSALDGGGNRRFRGFTICGYFADARFYPKDAAWLGGSGVRETRTIAGRPAQVIYSPLGPNHDFLFPVTVWVYDAATQGEYKIIAFDLSLIGANVDAVIAIAAGLFERE